MLHTWSAMKKLPLNRETVRKLQLPLGAALMGARIARWMPLVVLVLGAPDCAGTLLCPTP